MGDGNSLWLRDTHGATIYNNNNVYINGGYGRDNCRLSTISTRVSGTSLGVTVEAERTGKMSSLTKMVQKLAAENATLVHP